MISPLAYVDAGAKLGANVTVHPFAYIDKNVEIGDNCEIMPHASIMSGARLGKGNRVFNGAVIAAEPQDFKYKGDSTLVVIGDDNVIRENVVINRATTPEGRTVIGNGNFLHEVCMFRMIHRLEIIVYLAMVARFPATVSSRIIQSSEVVCWQAREAVSVHGR